MKAPHVNGGRVQFTVRLPPKLYQAAVKRAGREHRTMTSVVEMALAEYLKNET